VFEQFCATAGRDRLVDGCWMAPAAARAHREPAHGRASPLDCSERARLISPRLIGPASSPETARTILTNLVSWMRRRNTAMDAPIDHATPESSRPSITLLLSAPSMSDARCRISASAQDPRRSLQPRLFAVPPAAGRSDVMITISKCGDTACRSAETSRVLAAVAEIGRFLLLPFHGRRCLREIEAR